MKSKKDQTQEELSVIIFGAIPMIAGLFLIGDAYDYTGLAKWIAYTLGSVAFIAGLILPVFVSLEYQHDTDSGEK